jgi:hypothetical protein
MNILRSKSDEVCERFVHGEESAGLVSPGRKQGEIPTIEQRLERQKYGQGMLPQPSRHGRVSITRSISAGLM